MDVFILYPSLEHSKNTSLDTFVKVVFALGLQNELHDLFNQPTLTIAELEHLAVEPKRQRKRWHWGTLSVS